MQTFYERDLKGEKRPKKITHTSNELCIKIRFISHETNRKNTEEEMSVQSIEQSTGQSKNKSNSTPE